MLDFDTFNLVAQIALGAFMMLAGAAFLTVGAFWLRNRPLSPKAQDKWLKRLTRLKILPPGYPVSLRVIDELVSDVRRQLRWVAVTTGLAFLVTPLAVAALLSGFPSILHSGSQIPLALGWSLFDLAFFLAIALPIVLLGNRSDLPIPLAPAHYSGQERRRRAWYWWVAIGPLLAALGIVGLTAAYAAGALPGSEVPSPAQSAFLATPWLLWLQPSIATAVSLGELTLLLWWPARSRAVTVDPILNELALESWQLRARPGLLYAGFFAGMVVSEQSQLLLNGLQPTTMVAVLSGIVGLAGFASSVATMAVAIGVAIRETATSWAQPAHV
jgi:hypothetical protein